MEEWKKTSLFVSSIVIFSLVFDFVVSYLAYLDDPVYFIENEANSEAISFFVHGKIPIGNILIHTFIVTAFIIYCYRRLSQSKVSNGDRAIISSMSSFLVLLSVAHIFGGLSWFDENPYPSFIALMLAKGSIIIVSAIIVIVNIAVLTKFYDRGNNNADGERV